MLRGTTWVTMILFAALTGLPGCRRHVDPQPKRRGAESVSSTPSPTGSLAHEGDSGPGAATAVPWPLHAAPKVETEWCTPSLQPLDEQTCYFAPDKPTRVLLLYLHGIVPPGKPSRELVNLEDVVARACAREGAAALVPRGVQGLSRRHPGTWTWPTGARDQDHTVAALVERFTRDRDALERLLGVQFSRVYVAGSSAGAYFVTRLALHGDLNADGYAILSGGAGRAAEARAGVRHEPVYIGYGTYDRVGRAARELGKSFSDAGWSVKIAEHPVGHGTREVYLNEAFEFWRSALTDAE